MTISTTMAAVDGFGQGRPTPTPFRNIVRTPLPFMSPGDKLVSYTFAGVIMEDGAPVTGSFTLDLNNFHIPRARVMTAPDLQCCDTIRGDLPGSPRQHGNIFPGTTHTESGRGFQYGNAVMTFPGSHPCDAYSGQPNESAPCTFPAPAEFDFMVQLPEFPGLINLSLYVPAFDPSASTLALGDRLTPSVSQGNPLELRQSAVDEWLGAGNFGGPSGRGPRTAHAGSLVSVMQLARLHFGGPAEPVIEDVACIEGVVPDADPCLANQGPARARNANEVSSCGAPDESEWVACQPAQSGPKVKLWPILLPINKPLSIDSLTLVGGGGLGVTRIQGVATVSGDCSIADYGCPPGVTTSSFTFAGDLTPDGVNLSAPVSITGVAPLSTVVAPLMVSIAWSVQVAGAWADIGVSNHRVYVVGDFSPLPLKDWAPDSKYLSIVDLSTRAASGQAHPNGVVGAVWEQFRERHLHRVNLSESDGSLQMGALLRYWVPWSVEDYITNAYNAKKPATCVTGERATVRILSDVDTIGTCGDWAHFMVSALGSQGLPVCVAEPPPVEPTEDCARAVSLGQEVDSEHTPLFPELKDLIALDANVMLVGSPDQSWTFMPNADSPPTGPLGYPHADSFTVTPSYAVGKQEFVYNGMQAQGREGGKVDSPPGLFKQGDHVIVRFQGELWDPSYGHGPYPSLTDWADGSADGEPASLAGYGQVGMRAPNSTDLVIGFGWINPETCEPQFLPSGGTCWFYAHRGSLLIPDP